MEIRAVSATADINGTLLDSGGNTLAEAVQATSVGVDGITTLSMTRTLAVGTYYLRIDTGGSSNPDGPAQTGAYVVRATEDIHFQKLIEQCRSDSSVVQDLLYGCQWNLSNTGQAGGTAGEDINVEEAWETTLGSGIVVAVVDSRVDGTHEDLADNLDTANSHDYLAALGLTASPGVHGTAVAGVVAGRKQRHRDPRSGARSDHPQLQRPSGLQGRQRGRRHGAPRRRHRGEHQQLGADQRRIPAAGAAHLGAGPRARPG